MSRTAALQSPLGAANEPDPSTKWVKPYVEPRVLPSFTSLDETRQNVLMDMCFNLGTAGLLKFKAMLGAVEARDFDRAAAEMHNSAWARQVGERARTLAAMMKTGVA